MRPRVTRVVHVQHGLPPWFGKNSKRPRFRRLRIDRAADSQIALTDVHSCPTAEPFPWSVLSDLDAENSVLERLAKKVCPSMLRRFVQDARERLEHGWIGRING